MSNENMTMIRGDTFSFAIRVDFDEDVQELETAYFSCKSNYDDFNYVFQKSLDDGIEIVESGEKYVTYRIRVAPLDTKSLDPGNYFYDLQIGINYDIFTILNGILKIDKDITY